MWLRHRPSTGEVEVELSMCIYGGYSYLLEKKATILVTSSYDSDIRGVTETYAIGKDMIYVYAQDIHIYIFI